MKLKIIDRTESIWIRSAHSNGSGTVVIYPESVDCSFEITLDMSSGRYNNPDDSSAELDTIVINAFYDADGYPLPTMPLNIDYKQLVTDYFQQYSEDLTAFVNECIEATKQQDRDYYYEH